MFKATKIDNLFCVKFTGTKHQFADFINVVYSLPMEDRTINPKEKQYCFTEKGYRRLLFKFSDILPTLDELAPPTSLPKTNEQVPNVCGSFKLPLFNYQKKVVERSLASGASLIQLPCGTGKTAIGIGIFHELMLQKKIKAPGLIICKSSQKNQWPPEILKFSHFENVTILKTYAECGKSSEKVKEQMQNADLLVCNYETIKDPEVKEALHSLKLKYIYADEIHYIKSLTADRTKALWEFSYVPYRFGSTATAITNNPEDIYSIYNFIKPGLFKSLSYFRSTHVKYNAYGRVADGKNWAQLNSTIDPYHITLPAEEVNVELPDQVVIPRYVSLTGAQKEMHEKLMEELESLKKEEQSLMTKLKPKDMLGHPELQKIEGNIMARQTFAQFLADDERLLQMSDSEMANNYVTGSKNNKLKTFMSLIEEILESGEKVAVFTRYERMQRLLEEEIKKAHKGIKIAKINGKMNSSKRYEQAYDKFRDDDAYKTLLLTDAGCEGISLSKCKYLIEYEPAESYKTQTQRRGRNQRSDSIHSTVYVYQLITQDSWDEIALKIISKKEVYHYEISI